MEKYISGGCLCGNITFKLKDDFKMFFFCHCQQCRKLTGSAHASNLFTDVDNIEWTKGKDKTKRYDDPNRSFCTVFCTDCGSGLPYLTKSGKFLIVPAGSLNEEPTKTVDKQIFCEEQTEWHKAGLLVDMVDGFAK